MIYEILTTSSLLVISGTAYYFNNKKSDNDHEKIKAIADAIGLKTKNESIRIYRRSKKKSFTEYIYKMPLGLSHKQFKDNKQLFIDGLNNKSRPDLNLESFKKIKWRGDVIKQLKEILNNRIKLDKHLEIEYDGMLKFRVYDKGLLDEYKLTKGIINELKDWNVSLGCTLKGQITHDFEKGPHALIGGATDMGKSTIINVVFNTLLHNHPKDVEFTLIDLKGGLEFGPYKNVKQVKHFAKDVDTAEEVLEQVQRYMSDVFDTLERKGKRNVKDAGIKKRHFVIIDEAAELSSAKESDADIKKTKIKCENFIKDISRRGRASGIRLIYSTQHPTAETVDSQVKRNLTTRIALPVDTAISSNVILDEPGAERLQLKQGRAIYKRVRTQTMQSYLVEDDLISEIISPHISMEGKEGLDVERPPRKNSTVFEEV